MLLNGLSTHQWAAGLSRRKPPPPALYSDAARFSSDASRTLAYPASRDRIRLITRVLATISGLLFVVVGFLYARKPIAAIDLFALCIVLAIFDWTLHWTYELDHDFELAGVLLVWLSGVSTFLATAGAYDC